MKIRKCVLILIFRYLAVVALIAQTTFVIVEKETFFGSSCPEIKETKLYIVDDNYEIGFWETASGATDKTKRSGTTLLTNVPNLIPRSENPFSQAVAVASYQNEVMKNDNYKQGSQSNKKVFGNDFNGAITALPFKSQSNGSKYVENTYLHGSFYQTAGTFSADNRQSILSPVFGDSEDPFEPGGGEDPGNAYNDVPLGNSFFALLFIVLVYASKIFITNKLRKTKTIC